MNCCIYRSRKKQGSYLYITEKNNFSDVPEDLLRLFGNPEFAFEFELTEHKKLAQSNTQDVMQQLQENGFFLQIPPPAERITPVK